MRREMDLVRELLLKFEAMDIRAGGTYFIDYSDDFFALQDYTLDEVVYHLKLIREARLTEPYGNQGASGFTYSGLSWAGHDLLDSVREPEIWHKTKGAMKAAGSFTVDLMVSAAKAYTKQKLKEVTGLDL